MSTDQSQGVVIKVLAGGATDPGLDCVARAFERDTGHSVRVFFNLGWKGVRRVSEGEIFDVLVQPDYVMEEQFRSIGIAEKGGFPIGRVGLGILIRSGGAVSDFSNVAALKRTIAEADAILYTTATSGAYIEKMLRELELYEQTQARTERFPHGPELMDRLAGGKGRELALLTSTFARTRKDVVLAGLLPDEVQHYLDFEVVPSTNSRHKDVAWAFARYCAGQGKPLLVENGLM